MKQKLPLSAADKLIIAGMIIATVGIVIQIVSGVNYPKVPPVFFILLIPAGLVAFGRWRWARVLTILAGLFLLQGLLASGAYVRLLDVNRPGGFGGSAGLWIQQVGEVMATVAAIFALIRSYSVQTL